MINKGGRPKGARTRLNARLLDDLLADWTEHGAAAIKIMRMENPSKYVAMMVSTLPKDISVETNLSDLDDDEVDNVIEGIRLRLIEKRANIATPIETNPKAIEQVKPNGDDSD